MGIEEAFHAIEAQRKKKSEAIKENEERARKKVESILGKRKDGIYTYEDTVFYLKKVYKAEKIGVPEFLDYVDGPQSAVVMARKSDTPVKIVVDDYTGVTTPKDILLLPAKTPKERSNPALKNGCLLFLGERSGFMDGWSTLGNQEGYHWRDDFGYEMNILRVHDIWKVIANGN